ncbi:family 4A encapsulin nanocompartment shell protein [Thermococcus sp.]|uniref:family 4A encapsulin nanocompartment shell protein n=1 Tax=Thermococcus sp. TaxID=35749 RepID=UPI00261D2B5C|nr:family 4A encapsulin nanocompartment shell protein [Thermococcus sp.]
MRGDLIRVLSSIEEKANELKLDGYSPDVVLMGREAYEFMKEQVREEFGGDEELLELSGLRVRLLDELGGDAVVADSASLGFEGGGAKRIRVIQ